MSGGRGLVCAGRRVGHLPHTSVTEGEQAGEGSEVELSGLVLTGDLQFRSLTAEAGDRQGRHRHVPGPVATTNAGLDTVLSEGVLQALQLQLAPLDEGGLVVVRDQVGVVVRPVGKSCGVLAVGRQEAGLVTALALLTDLRADCEVCDVTETGRYRMLQKQVAIVVTVVIAHLHVTETRLKVGDGEVVTLPDTVLGLEPLVLVAELSLPAELTVPWRMLGCLVGTAALTTLRAHQLLTVGIALEPQVTQGATQSLTVLLSQSPPGHHRTVITDPPSHPPAGVHPGCKWDSGTPSWTESW